MTLVQKLAKFVEKASFERLSHTAREQLKIRILDALGCAIGALSSLTLKKILHQVEDFGGLPHSTLIGGGKTAPDRAAFYNSALVRYLDFNDSYLAKGETCHPSDNFGSVLAAAEYAHKTGKDLLVALAVAYQVQCRLSDEAPVRAKGFDHTTQGAYAVAAGVAKALGLDWEKSANAIAISGTAYNALRVTRTGALSHWKGLAYPNTAFGGTHAAFLAMRGITGPEEVFEGNKGFIDAIAGRFDIDWEKEDLERVNRTIIKKYNAEIHSQATLEGILELKQQYGLTGDKIKEIEVNTFDVAYHIIGGGEEGDKTVVRTKEEADHSLHYMVAAALLDGEVMPDQYLQDRIEREDVQSLLRKVKVRENKDYSRRFPNEMPCDITVSLSDGRVLKIEKKDYEGFFTRPTTWKTAERKFEQLTDGIIAPSFRREFTDAVGSLEEIEVSALTALLAKVPRKG